jgi:hypothetical protein
VTTRPTGSLIEDRPRSLSPVSSECGSEAAEEGKGHLVSVPPAVAVAEK